VPVIRPANVLFEVDGVTEAVAARVLRLAPQAAHQDENSFRGIGWVEPDRLL